MPLPFWANPPAPLTPLVSVKVSMRLTAKIAPASTATLPMIEPVVPPSPSCKVPPLTVVPPLVGVVAGKRQRAAADLDQRAPVPPKVPPSLIVPLTVVERLLLPTVSWLAPRK